MTICSKSSVQNFDGFGGSESGKTNTLLNFISQQDEIYKIYLYAKDLSEPKYKFLFKKREDAGIKHLNDPNAFFGCSNTMNDVYESINNFNSNRKRKIWIAVDDMIADIITNKTCQAIIKELFIRCRKLNISLLVITKSYFSVPKDVRLNSTLFDDENRQQKRITKYCNKSFCRYRLQTFCENLQRMHKKTVFFF